MSWRLAALALAAALELAYCASCAVRGVQMARGTVKPSPNECIESVAQAGGILAPKVAWVRCANAQGQVDFTALQGQEQNMLSTLAGPIGGVAKQVVIPVR